MTEFSVNDRVLVPGEVTAYGNTYARVRFEETEDEIRFAIGSLDLRPERSENAEDRGYQPLPDTGGRDLTGKDVADAVREWTAEDTHYAQIAEELNRIARGDARTGVSDG